MLLNNEYWQNKLDLFLILPLALLFALSIWFSNAAFASIGIVCTLLIFNLFNRTLYYFVLIVILPFTYIITVFLYNTELFSNNFKALASIKVISFVVLPVLISGIRFVNKLKLRRIDVVFFLFIAINCVYFFVVGEGGGSSLTGLGDGGGNSLSNLIQMIPFVIFIYIGQTMYFEKIDIKKIENYYLYTCIVIILIGIPMYFGIDTLPEINLSPKKYAIDSIGMGEWQFIGEYPANVYSNILDKYWGRTIRFFSVFYSGIGLAYFLSVGFIIAFYRRYYFILIITALAIIATFTRAAWILIFISPIIVALYVLKNRFFKLLLVITIISTFITTAMNYMHIIYGFLFENKKIAYDFVGADQSAAEHIRSIIVLVDLIKNRIFGYGMNFDSGESFFVDVFARTGIFGLLIFILIFILLINKLTASLNSNVTVHIAFCLILFNLLGSLFSKENYTIIDSYMSWIYIGYVYADIINNKDKMPTGTINKQHSAVTV